MTDDKYIVFKRSEFERWLYAIDPVPLDEAVPTPVAVSDAVVIRRQDVFAGPALHVYANCIALVARGLKSESELDMEQMAMARRLQEIADYFHGQAVAADEEGKKWPD